MVVVDGSTFEENDLKHPEEKLPLPWVLLRVRNGDLFIPKSHYETPTKGLKYSSDECITKFCLLDVRLAPIKGDSTILPIWHKQWKYNESSRSL